MRVLVLSQYYEPEPIPKPSELAIELVHRGHEVTVLTGLPNYPTGALSPGYRVMPLMRERLHDIPVLRVFEIPYHGHSSAGRLLNYASFALSASFAALAVRRPDVVYVWHPPLTVGIPACVFRTMRGVPFVYDLQDVWPDEAILAGAMRDGLSARAMRGLERVVYARASRIVVETDGARRNLLAKGVPAERLRVIPHWVFDDALERPSDGDIARARARLGGADQFIVTFAGNVGLAQGLDTVLRAAALLRDEPRLAIRIVGDGSDLHRLRGIAERERLANVVFVGRLPSREMPAIFRASDVLLVHLRRRELAELVLPLKTLTYLAAERPLLVATGGAAEDVVTRSEAGIAVAPDAPEAMAAAIRRLAAMDPSVRAAMGRKGRRFVIEHFSRDHVVDELERSLVEAAAS